MIRGVAIVLNVGVAPFGYYEMGWLLKRGCLHPYEQGVGGGITSVGQNAEVVIIN